MKKLKIATVFSGVGAFEFALKKLSINNEIEFACDNGERELPFSFDLINNQLSKLDHLSIQSKVKSFYSNTNKQNFVKSTYFLNHNIDESKWYEDIRFLNGDKWRNKIDILVGGSPCQSFSIMGKRAGLNDARGTLFYDYARLVNTISPKVFIFENVPGMVTHDKGNTWRVVQDVFKSLDYKIFSQVLNSIDYGIPQNRKRLFVVGFKNQSVKFKFPEAKKLKLSFNDLLDKNVSTKYYLPKKGFEFVTNPKYKNRARVNPSIMQTQKANQQFNWNGDFVFEDFEKVNSLNTDKQDIYYGYYNGKKGAIRKLTPIECFRFMGFPENLKLNVPDVQAYRQAGNSIVINVLEALIKEIMEAINEE